MVGEYIGDRGGMNRDAGERQKSTYRCANNGRSKRHYLDGCLGECLAGESDEPVGRDGCEFDHVDGVDVVEDLW